MPLFQESKLWQINISEKEDHRVGDHFPTVKVIWIFGSPPSYTLWRNISLRLLNEKSQPLSAFELGLLPRDERNIGSVFRNLMGLFWLPVQTGSGKSLTAFIRKSINLKEGL